MADPIQTLRTSVHAFLKDYHYFTSFPALVGFPYALSILLSHSFFSGFLRSVSGNLRNLFYSAGFPSTEFIILDHKLSQTISSSIFSLPFTLSFLLISKAIVIQVLDRKTSNFSITSLYRSLLSTYICNSIIIIAANATVFFLLFFVFNCFEEFFTLFVSMAGAVLYSIVVANAFLICNSALILSGIERCGGYLAIIKACVLIRGRTSIALSLALPTNLTLAAIEALFQYRIIRPYRVTHKTGASMVLEGVFIAYLYSIVVVLDTIITTVFVKSWTKSKPFSDLGGKCSCWINGEKEETESYPDLKIIRCDL